MLKKKLVETEEMIREKKNVIREREDELKEKDRALDEKRGRVIIFAKKKHENNQRKRR